MLYLVKNYIFTGIRMLFLSKNENKRDRFIENQSFVDLNF